MKAKWSVLALYENAEARQLAVGFCDALIERFWSEFSFELSWGEWSDLEDPARPKQAELRAIDADLIIIATSRVGTLPPRLKSWLELSLRDRGDREGVLVGLPAPETGISAEAASTQVYLRKLAHHSGMDYLTAVPESLPHRAPESLESYRLRATQVTSVLDTILHHSPIPPRML